MAEIIEMPKLSDTMEEGGIASWLKKEGEFIEEGEAFVEIETDKATMEYNSPAEGYLLKILVPAGKTSPLNQPIAVLGEKGEKVDIAALTQKSGKPTSVPEAPSKAKAESAPEPKAKAPEPRAAASSPSPTERMRASPLAKKMAADKQLSLDQIEGSGPQGRVVQRDIENALREGEGQKPAPVEAKAPAAAPQKGDQDLPLSMMRKTIAKRLQSAKSEAPHFYLTRSVNMTRFNDWRTRLNLEAEERKLPKVSVNDLLVLAAARALVKHPEVNSSWQGDSIRRFAAVHVAIAVAIPDGLITPVISNANQLGARDIAAQSRELIEKAKKGQLKPEEYQGGTFSISNLGMMGIEHFTAIINPPQAAILAVGATIPTPWVGAEGVVLVQPRMTMTLSCDHRVVDGAVGASFLQTLAAYLEDPLLILS